jgi:hypothetical protein
MPTAFRKSAGNPQSIKAIRRRRATGGIVSSMEDLNDPAIATG